MHTSTGLIVDNFAGGGGASTGIEQALQRAVDIAINHDEEAIRMHEVNHPGTLHLRNDIWEINPMEVTGGRHVQLAWFSPDCKHFSKAKGGKPRDKSIRDLAWVVVLWAKVVKPDAIFLENVEEFRTWGPLDEAGQPIKARAGETFAEWTEQLRREGYVIQWRELRACDYGAPTIRKRFFMIARRDGQPIVWPEPTHGKPDSPEVLSGRRLPWRTAAEIIDWSTPCPSIFEREKPLAEKTLRRIAAGIMRFVVNNPAPFIVPLTHHGSDARSYGSDQPLPTVTGANRGEMAAIVPHITKFRSGAVGNGADEPVATITANSFVKRPGGAAPLGRVDALLAPFATYAQQGGLNRSVEDPMHTICASKKDQNCVVVAHVEQANGGPNNKKLAGRAADQPLSTIATKGSQQRLVTSHLMKMRGTCKDGQTVDKPMPTVTSGGNHIAEVRAFLVRYFDGEVEGDGPVLVTVNGEKYVIVDIGMRMLTPRELFNAQGFPPDYIIDRDADGKPMTKTSQVARCGNSVSPPVARAIVEANLGNAQTVRERVVA